MINSLTKRCHEFPAHPSVSPNNPTHKFTHIPHYSFQNHTYSTSVYRFAMAQALSRRTLMPRAQALGIPIGIYTYNKRRKKKPVRACTAQQSSCADASTRAFSAARQSEPVVASCSPLQAQSSSSPAA